MDDPQFSDTSKEKVFIATTRSTAMKMFAVRCNVKPPETLTLLNGSKRKCILTLSQETERRAVFTYEYEDTEETYYWTGNKYERFDGTVISAGGEQTIPDLGSTEEEASDIVPTSWIVDVPTFGSSSVADSVLNAIEFLKDSLNHNSKDVRDAACVGLMSLRSSASHLGLQAAGDD